MSDSQAAAKAAIAPGGQATGGMLYPELTALSGAAAGRLIARFSQLEKIW
jgi:hypothetical protein